MKLLLRGGTEQIPQVKQQKLEVQLQKLLESLWY